MFVEQSTYTARYRVGIRDMAMVTGLKEIGRPVGKKGQWTT